jgi:hypothetical protein
MTTEQKIERLITALVAAEDALRNSRPTHDHYPEPIARHEAAHRLTMTAISDHLRGLDA